MKIEAFEWDAQNETHIARHGVSPEELEEVFVGPFFHRKTREGKYAALGQTLEGRYLFVIFVLKPRHIIRPITAREMDKKDVRTYRKWRKG
ncbi:MAG: BrnT family toxin [Armatimonadetes bacterium]|nr:BrnT family toxin [Armatimonadota bacterium]